jgi:hypothetical protein
MPFFFFFFFFVSVDLYIGRLPQSRMTVSTRGLSIPCSWMSGCILSLMVFLVIGRFHPGLRMQLLRSSGMPVISSSVLQFVAAVVMVVSNSSSTVVKMVKVAKILHHSTSIAG